MWRQRIAAFLVCVGFMSVLTGYGPAAAHAVGRAPAMQNAQAVAALAGAPAHTRVCSPKKCITVLSTQVCPKTRPGCVKGEWIPWTGYCSSSYGCVTIDGKNYIWSGSTIPKGPVPLACTVGLGFSIAAFYAGPGGWAAAGVLMSAWGCAG
jgi:hypothetical protein